MAFLTTTRPGGWKRRPRGRKAPVKSDRPRGRPAGREYSAELVLSLLAGKYADLLAWTCAWYGISPHTGRKYIARYLSDNPAYAAWLAEIEAPFRELDALLAARDNARREFRRQASAFVDQLGVEALCDRTTPLPAALQDFLTAGPAACGIQNRSPEPLDIAA